MWPGEDPDASATRVWCALEVVKKADIREHEEISDVLDPAAAVHAVLHFIEIYDQPEHECGGKKRHHQRGTRCIKKIEAQYQDACGDQENEKEPEGKPQR